MRDSDVSPSEVRKISNISDSELDAIRNGEIGLDDVRLGDVARFVSDVGCAYPEESVGACEATHVAAMMEAAHLIAQEGEPATRPASDGDRSLKKTDVPQSGRETVFQKYFAATWVRLTAATVALLLTFTGIAVAGVLPQPVQHAVANTVAPLGVNLPGGDDEEAAEAAEEAAAAQKEAAEKAAEAAANAQEASAEASASATQKVESDDTDNQGDNEDQQSSVKKPESDDNEDSNAQGSDENDGEDHKSSAVRKSDDSDDERSSASQSDSNDEDGNSSATQSDQNHGDGESDGQGSEND